LEKIVQNPYKQCILDDLSPFLEKRWCIKLSTAMFKGTELSNSNNADDVAIQMSKFNHYINIIILWQQTCASSTARGQGGFAAAAWSSHGRGAGSLALLGGSSCSGSFLTSSEAPAGKQPCMWQVWCVSRRCRSNKERVAGYTPAIAWVDLKQLARGLAIHYHWAAGMNRYKAQTSFAQENCAYGERSGNTAAE